MDELFYSVEKISELLQMHPKTIQRYIREGRLKAQKIGKSWRVSGHDLSVFIEGGKNEGADSTIRSDGQRSPVSVMISSVIDIDGIDRMESIRIINTVTAAMNSKPAEYGQATMNAQYLASEHTVRLMLWGRLAFVQTILETIQLLTTP